MYKFTHEWKSTTGATAGYSISFESEGETLDELLQHFQQFLQSCGFSFGLNEHIAVIDEDEMV